MLRAASLPAIDTQNGNLELFDIAHNQVVSATQLGAVGMEWQVAGFGPANGVGTSDMILRDTQTGAFEVYDISNDRITSATSLGAVGLDWSVEGVAADPPTAPSTSASKPDASHAQFVQALASFPASASARRRSSLRPPRRPRHLSLRRTPFGDEPPPRLTLALSHASVTICRANMHVPVV